jgi:hypothetical protein
MRGFLGFRKLRFSFLGELKQGSNLAELDVPAFHLAGLNRCTLEPFPFSLKRNPSYTVCGWWQEYER